MRWTARLRDPDLNLLEQVNFSSLTLVRNYNAPATLAVEGRLDHIRTLLRPGHGLVVRNDLGQQFSGRLVSGTRRGDGTGTALFTGDLVRLWDRVCYPNTNLAWDSQIAARDIVTGTLEDRILSLVDRNAGPGAWHSGITGTDPGDSTVFTQWKVIIPDERTQVVMCVTPDPVNGDLYMVQRNGHNDAVIRQLDSTGLMKATMTVQLAGQVEELFVSSVGSGSKRKVYLTFPYRTSGPSAQNGSWLRLQFTADKTWKSTQALAYRISNPPLPIITPRLPRRAGLHGEVFYGSYLFRLYGTPYNTAGSTVSPAIPAVVEIIDRRTFKLLKTIPAAHLARDAANNPYDGFLAPAGLSVATVAGQPCLIVGFCTGTTTGSLGNGLIAQRLYSLPLKPAPRAAQDRRIPNLRMPTTKGRGATGTTTVRFDVLGPLVAKLAESANLSVSLDYAYDKSGAYLNLSLTDTPDLSDTIRVGAGGPVPLGTDWSYTDAIPGIITGLSAAGGDGSDRILTEQTDPTNQDLWDARIEAFVDQRQTTDLSEIDDGLTKAMADASGSSDISIPLGASPIWADIPLGARIAAVLDGQPMVERIRQTTTVVSGIATDPTERTTAVLGAPDAGLKTPTQKQLAAMLRRLQNLERN